MNIYVARSGQQTGPYSENEVRLMVKDGRALASDPGWRDGLAEWRPLYEILRIARPMPPPPPVTSSSPRSPLPSAASGAGAPSSPASRGSGGGSAVGMPVYFYISTGRLAGMTFLSMGLFPGYWVYRNWRNIQQRDGSSILPFWRGVFALFYVGPLLDAIKRDPVANGISPARFSARPLATVWKLMVLIGGSLGRSPDLAQSLVGTAISLLSVCFLVPVQDYVNTVVDAAGTGRRHDPWSPGQIFCGVIGVILWGVTLVEISGGNPSAWVREPATPAAAPSSPTPAPFSIKPASVKPVPAHPVTPAPLTTAEYAEAEKESLARAEQLYPDAAVAGTRLYNALQSRKQQLLRDNLKYFSTPHWPEKLVREVAEGMGIWDTRVVGSMETLRTNADARNARNLDAFMETIHPFYPDRATTKLTMEQFFNEGLYRFSMSDAVVLHEDDNEVRISCRTRYWKEDLSGTEIRRKMNYTLRQWMGQWKVYNFEVVGEY